VIRHVVLFRLSADTPEQRAADFAGMKERLEGLVGQIPGMLGLEVRGDLGLVRANWDVVLISQHETPSDLEAYQEHPAHREAGAWAESVSSDIVCVDSDMGA
jgi:hypothetical protein